MSKVNLTNDQIQAIINGDAEALAQTLPIEDTEKANAEAARLLKRVAKATKPKAQKRELVDPSDYFPGPKNRETRIVLVDGNGKVRKTFENIPVTDAKTGKKRSPRGMESETAKNQLRTYLTDHAGEWTKIQKGQLRIELRHSVPMPEAKEEPKAKANGKARKTAPKRQRTKRTGETKAPDSVASAAS